MDGPIVSTKPVANPPDFCYNLQMLAPEEETLIETPKTRFYPPPFFYRAVACFAAVLIALGFAAEAQAVDFYFQTTGGSSLGENTTHLDLSIKTTGSAGGVKATVTATGTGAAAITGISANPNCGSVWDSVTKSFDATTAMTTSGPTSYVCAVRLFLADDSVYTGDRTLTLTITAPAGHGTVETLGGAEINYTFQENDPKPRVRFNNFTVNEGDAGDANEARFSVEAFNPGGQSVVRVAEGIVKFRYQLAQAGSRGTATHTIDYTSDVESVSFQSGLQASGSGNVRGGLLSTIGNTAVDGDKTVIFTIFDLEGADFHNDHMVTNGRITITGTIIDDDAGVSISTAQTSVTEGTELVFTLMTSIEPLSTTEAVSVPVNITQSGNYNYLPAGAPETVMATFAAGETTAIVRIATDDDNTDEDDGMVTVSIDPDGLPDTHTVGGSAAVRVTDDEEIPFLVVGNGLRGQQWRVSETVDRVEIPLRLIPHSGEVTGRVSEKPDIFYSYTTGVSTLPNPASTDDYDVINNTVLTFQPGVDFLTATVTGIREDADDDVENSIRLQFNISALNPASVKGSICVRASETASCTGEGTYGMEIILTENPTVSIAGPATPVSEGEDAVFTVTLAKSLPQGVTATVNYATSDGTATAGEDYTARSGTLNFSATQTVQLITVPVSEDSTYEGATAQTFTVTLTGASGGAPGKEVTVNPTASSAEANIADGDSEPILTVADITVPDGEDLVFTAQLSQATQGVDVTLSYSTNLDTENSSVTTVDIREFRNVKVTIPAGETSATFTVETRMPLGADKDEDVVTVRLHDLMNAVFAGGAATLDVTGTIRKGGSTVEEGGSTVGEANKAVLPQVATVAAMQITGAVSGRINAVFDGRRDENDFSVRGKNWKQFLASEAEAARGNERAELPDLDLNLSDFAFSIAADGDEWGGGDSSGGGALDNLGIWGRGYYGGVDVKEAGDASNVDFDGSIVGGVIGADVLLNDKVVTGLGVNFSKSGVDFQTGESSGTHDTTVWSFHPYIGLKAGPKVTLYATAGYGIGSLEAMETGGGTPRENDVSLLTGGAGGKGTVYDTKAGAWDVKVNVLGDFVYAQLSEDGGIDASGGIFRGGFEVAGDSGGGAGASLKLAYRADFGDTVGGSGLEVGGGLRFGSPSSGISVNLDGRILAYHSEELSEYGFSGDVSWSRGKTGPYAKFSPTWGAVNDRRDDLWENGANGWSEADSSGRRYNFEAGYGVGLPEEAGIMKLFARSEMEDGETVFRSGGVDVEVGSGLTAGYETVDRSGATVEHRGYLRFGGAF